MPIITTIDAEEALVHHSVEGELTFGEIVEAIQRLFSNPDFRPEMDILIEITPGATSKLSSIEVNNVAEMLRAQGEKRGTGRSVVVASDDADFGLVRMLAYRLDGGERETNVFKTLEKAKEWLMTEKMD